MVITVSGVVEYHNAQQIPGAVHAAIVRWTPKEVFVDLAEVTSMDSAGIGALVASHKAAASAAVTVAVLNPSPSVYRHLRVRRLADMLCPQLTTRSVTGGRRTARLHRRHIGQPVISRR